jgi:hypothetical protein
VKLQKARLQDTRLLNCTVLLVCNIYLYSSSTMYQFKRVGKETLAKTLALRRLASSLDSLPGTGYSTLYGITTSSASLL